MRFESLRGLRFGSCLVLFLTTIAAPVHADVRPGVEAGMNFSSLSYDDDDQIPFPYWNRGWRTSFTGGASFEIPFTERFGLVTGLRYVQQGNRVEYDTGPSGFQVLGEFRVVQNYLAIPVLLGFRPLPSRRFQFTLGPELAFLLSARLIVEQTLPAEVTEYQDIGGRMESTNLSLNAGAAYEFPMENHVGLVMLRYTHGLTGVAKEVYWVSNWKTRGVEGLVGMRW